MSDFLPPVVITLMASIAQTTEPLAVVGEQLGALGAEANVAGEQITTGMGKATAGVGRFSSSVVDESAAVTASNDRIIASFAQVSAAADRTAEQYYVDSAGMAARSQQLAAQMEAANAKAIASTEALGAKMEETAAKGSLSGSKLEGAAKKMLLVGAGAAVVAGASIKMAADFETSTTRLVTSAGETQDNLQKVRDGILGLAGDVGYSAEELSKGLYTIESGGQHGADGLKVLRAAAEGAKTENAELKTVADAVTSVLVDYHLKADSAATVTSKLVAATSVGKTTFEELSGAMSAVLPVASAAHVSLDDILGDMASMTVHGMSAQQSAQNLADTIRHMQAPTATQTKELALLGMSAQNLTDSLSSKGLSGTLQEISQKIRSSMGPEATRVILDLGSALRGLSAPVQDLGQKLMAGSITQAQYNKAAKDLDPIAAHQASQFATLAANTHQIGNEQMSGQEVMQNYSQALYKATGDATGLNVALMLTGENADVTNGAIKTIGGAATEAGDHVKGWSEIQGTFNQKLSQAKDGLGALAISVGQKLLPVASKIAGVIANVTQWLSKNQWAATALAIVVGGALVLAFSALLVVFWGFASNPVTWIIAGIIVLVAALAVGIYELWTHWNQIWGWCTARFKEFGDWVGKKFDELGRFFTDFFPNIGRWFRDRWNEIWKWCSDRITEFKEWVGQKIDELLRFFRDLPGNILRALGNFGMLLINAGIDLLKGLWHGIQNAAGWLWDQLRNFAGNLVNKVLGFFGIHSPSRVFAEMGGHLVSGLALGIQSSTSLAVDAVHAMGSKVKSAASGLSINGSAHFDASSSMSNARLSDGMGGTVVYVTVQGTVLAERDLQAQIQKSTLRYNARNSSNGLALGVA